MASALVANFMNEILEVELMSFCLFVYLHGTSCHAVLLAGP